jgi:hypothetical protein
VVTHVEKGMSRRSMIGTTSSGTLIVLLGTYVFYVLIGVGQRFESRWSIDPAPNARLSTSAPDPSDGAPQGAIARQPDPSGHADVVVASS